MPLIGLIDPTHEERANDEPGRYPAWTTSEELLTAAASTWEPKTSPWTYELLKAAMDEHQERDYFSSSMISGGCARSTILERKEEYIGTLDDMYASLKGTQKHRTLERAARPGSIPEARFFTTIEIPKAGEIEFSCSPDLVDPVTLWDYKQTENPPPYSYPRRSHTRQLQINRYVVNHAESWETRNDEALAFDPREWKCQHLAAVYLGPKWPKILECKHTIDVQTPNNKTVRRAVPYIWDDEMVLAEIVPRVTGMMKALKSYPEWPEGLEEYPGFEGPPTWACPGPPQCFFDCLAKRYPSGLKWEHPKE